MHAVGLIAISALLAIMALLMLSWAYARAEAQVLVPVEYTGFLWAALFGWWWFAEPVGLATVAGAVLIVLGCWIAARQTRAGLPQT
jgi:S-adenosylmethionine uptake transporter